MKSKLLMAAVAGTALLITSPAMAGGGRGGGVGAGMGGAAGGMGHAGGGGSVGADMKATHSQSHDTGVSTRTDARLNSQGPAHASDRAIERANENSVLSGSTTTGDAQLKLETGLTVRDTNGTTLGMISRINRSADGTIRNVLVKSASGKRKIITLAPDTLSVNGDVVTTTHLATSDQRR